MKTKDDLDRAVAFLDRLLELDPEHEDAIKKMKILK